MESVIKEPENDSLAPNVPRPQTMDVVTVDREKDISTPNAPRPEVTKRQDGVPAPRGPRPQVAERQNKVPPPSASRLQMSPKKAKGMMPYCQSITDRDQAVLEINSRIRDIWEPAFVAVVKGYIGFYVGAHKSPGFSSLVLKGRRALKAISIDPALLEAIYAVFGDFPTSIRSAVEDVQTIESIYSDVLDKWPDLVQHQIVGVTEHLAQGKFAGKLIPVNENSRDRLLELPWRVFYAGEYKGLTMGDVHRLLNRQAALERSNMSSAITFATPKVPPEPKVQATTTKSPAADAGALKIEGKKDNELSGDVDARNRGENEKIARDVVQGSDATPDAAIGNATPESVIGNTTPDSAVRAESISIGNHSSVSSLMKLLPPLLKHVASDVYDRTTEVQAAQHQDIFEKTTDCITKFDDRLSRVEASISAMAEVQTGVAGSISALAEVQTGVAGSISSLVEAQADYKSAKKRIGEYLTKSNALRQKLDEELGSL